MTTTSDDNNNTSSSESYENQQIVDLCAYCFGFAFALFLMYLVWPFMTRPVDDSAAVFWMTIFAVLTLVTAFGFFAIVFKIKKLLDI